MLASEYKQCTLCPRECKADRTKTVGFCGVGGRLMAAKAMVHNSEEPCISGSNGSGAIFFSGCVLRCAFCQNSKISHERFGIDITDHRLSEIILELQSSGVHNINMVSGTQFYPSIIHALDMVSDKLTIPVIWNTGGYEKVDTVRKLIPYCSVFLQDIKFASEDVSMKYASCKDYNYHAMKATEVMLKEVGSLMIDENGIIKKGVIIRHLVLPSNRGDSINLLKSIKANFGCEGFLISLMSQYTPPKFKTGYKELSRRITDFEYKSVCDVAIELGFEGYFQSRESAQSAYTPIFDLSGL